MKTRIQKWENSLAVQIPQSYIDELDIAENTLVEFSVVNGALMIRPLHKSKLTLEELLAGVTAENMHGAISTGRPVGREML